MFFFFSSRRRHTRSLCDWSSDVCSSDLGGIMQGRTISGGDVEELAKLPPLEILRGQVIGAVIAPLNNLLALVAAPLQNIHGLIDARIEQLGVAAEAAAPGDAPDEAPGEEAPSEETPSEETP